MAKRTAPVKEIKDLLNELILDPVGFAPTPAAIANGTALVNAVRLADRADVEHFAAATEYDLIAQAGVALLADEVSKLIGQPNARATREPRTHSETSARAACMEYGESKAYSDHLELLDQLHTRKRRAATAQEIAQRREKACRALTYLQANRT